MNFGSEISNLEGTFRGRKEKEKALEMERGVWNSGFISVRHVPRSMGKEKMNVRVVQFPRHPSKPVERLYTCLILSSFSFYNFLFLISFPFSQVKERLDFPIKVDKHRNLNILIL